MVFYEKAQVAAVGAHNVLHAFYAEAVLFFIGLGGGGNAAGHGDFFGVGVV